MKNFDKKSYFSILFCLFSFLMLQAKMPFDKQKEAEIRFDILNSNVYFEVPNEPNVEVVENKDGSLLLKTNSIGSCKWSTGETGNTILVRNSGAYTLTVTVDGKESLPALVIVKVSAKKLRDSYKN